MFGNFDDNPRNGSKRVVRGGHSVSGTFGNYHLPVDHSSLKKMTILKIVAYTLGFGGSGWLLFLRIGGWKADFLWLSMAGFWLVQLARALVKLYFEIKHEQIELQEKKARYNKDIFT